MRGQRHVASQPRDSTHPAADTTAARTEMPKLRRPAREVFAEMYERKGLDADWLDGKVFSLVYPTGRSDIDDVLIEANNAYLFENALNPLRFPSVSRMQREVVNMVSSLVKAPDGSGAGFTAGGT